MKHLLLTAIAAVALVGCATTQSPTSPLFDAVKKGDIEAVKQHLDAGADVNARIRFKPGALSHLKGNARLDRSILGYKVTPLDLPISRESPHNKHTASPNSQKRVGACWAKELKLSIPKSPNSSANKVQDEL